MKFKVLYNPEVYTDIQESVHWYNEQQPGLGRRFYLVLKNHLHKLEKGALQFAVRYDDVRCMPLKKFPFMIHYRVDMNNRKVYIEAVFHTNRNPKIWNQRSRNR